MLSAKTVESFYSLTNFSRFQILFSDSNAWWPLSACIWCTAESFIPDSCNDLSTKVKETWNPTVLGWIRKPLELAIPKQDIMSLFSSSPVSSVSSLSILCQYSFWSMVIVNGPVSIMAGQPQQQGQLPCTAVMLKHHVDIPLQGSSPAPGARMDIWQSLNMFFHQRPSRHSPACYFCSRIKKMSYYLVVIQNTFSRFSVPWS